MAADLILKAHDTYPPLNVVLSDQNGAINLATASQVKLIMKNTGIATQVLVTGTMAIASAAGGNVTYAWRAADTSWPDLYNVEFEIAWTAGGIETVPNDIYRQIQINQDLENA